MKVYIDESGAKKIAVIEEAQMVSNAQDALDLLMDTSYHHDTTSIVLPKSLLPEEFFDLKTGLAGEILQKISTYHARLAIVGDFSNVQSKSLRDFIRESNKRGQVIFAPSVDDALRSMREKE